MKKRSESINIDLVVAESSCKMDGRQYTRIGFRVQKGLETDTFATEPLCEKDRRHMFRNSES